MDFAGDTVAVAIEARPISRFVAAKRRASGGAHFRAGRIIAPLCRNHGRLGRSPLSVTMTQAGSLLDMAPRRIDAAAMRQDWRGSGQEHKKGSTPAETPPAHVQYSFGSSSVTFR
ncbi:hypothetical protein J2X37_001831 [Croceicoccus sp. BE223]|nr:hypothetical protein [Croceicoccus sp. BE223]